MGSKRGHVAVWFEIPAANYQRAVGFYEKVFAVKLKEETFGGMKGAVLLGQGVDDFKRQRSGE
ncbi:MAG: hypothetical protein HY751_02130 [Nitrospinae bacterium]|nr:hypothetical protein [Nitrospinota bacterium]